MRGGYPSRSREFRDLVYCHRNRIGEFDFRYSNRVTLGYSDADRADVLLSGVVGKRLAYQQTGA
jgi:hypothetical protein